VDGGKVTNGKRKKPQIRRESEMELAKRKMKKNVTLKRLQPSYITSSIAKLNFLISI
jgi:hypothetical protein